MVIKSFPFRSVKEGGRFTDAAGPLLSLFADPDGRGARSWNQVFGLKRVRPARRKGYLALGMRGFN